MPDSLRTHLLRVASELPKGDPTRRKLLKALDKTAGTFDDFVPPPSLNWDKVRKDFDAAHSMWWKGLEAYKDVMEYIEAGAKRDGPEYREVVELAKRGQGTARHLLDQQNAIQDDLYAMQGVMPQTED